MTKPLPELLIKLGQVDIHGHWVRQGVSDRDIDIDIKWVDTNAMVADGLSKALSTEKHARFMSKNGIQREEGRG